MPGGQRSTEVRVLGKPLLILRNGLEERALMKLGTQTEVREASTLAEKALIGIMVLPVGTHRKAAQIGD